MTRWFRLTGEPIDVDDRLPVLVAELLADTRVVAAYLFGSYGTPEQTPLSDVDVALLLRRDVAVTGALRLDFIGRIGDALGEEDVSVTLLNDAPLPLQFEILSTGRLLLVTDEEALADFVEHICKRYGDYAIDYLAMLAEYDAALREDSDLHG
ncbi:MAG: nucleotidyltransferase domain-containing protein [Firmicutes bacterium]|nr:nucleotidyltransferase domain-containing protein [Bacillota bacterium]